VEARSVNILLVEDNQAHARLVTRGIAAQRIRNRISHVADGAAALDYLRHRPPYEDACEHPIPDLILLDLQLPKVNGLEVLRQVKTDDELKKIPVVVLTTSSASDDIDQAYALQANSYLVKPLDFASFAQLMRDLGFYWLNWNRPPLLR
jgi:CheY-like chemotaxis protein